MPSMSNKHRQNFVNRSKNTSESISSERKEILFYKMAENSWNWLSFFIGFLVGLIVISLLVWIFYITRTLFFSHCASQQRICVSSDYYNNPGIALEEGAVLENILFVQDGKLIYKRFQKNSTCTPSTDQEVVIRRPQQCAFITDSGTYNGRNFSFGSEKYSFTDSSGNKVNVVSSSNCVPVSSTGNVVKSGTPLAQWEEEPLLIITE